MISHLNSVSISRKWTQKPGSCEPKWTCTDVRFKKVLQKWGLFEMVAHIAQSEKVVCRFMQED